MKRIVNALVFSAVLVAGQSACGQQREESLIKENFGNCKAAILDGKGDEAIKLLDSRTVKYYSQVLDLVKTADAAKIETLSVLDRLMVFSVRHQTSKEDLLKFDGKSLLADVISKGMVGKISIANSSIGDVAIDNDTAKGQLLVNGQKSPAALHFYKEEDQWKIDLTSLFPFLTVVLQNAITTSGQGQNDFLIFLLGFMTGKKPESGILNPVM